jgi:hypothetical protein
MVMGRRRFVNFRGKNQGCGLHMLNPAIDQTSRHSRDKCREHKPSNHDFNP